MAAKSPQDDRKERLAAALRENLKRRKAQARARIQPPAAAEAASHSQDGVAHTGAAQPRRR